MINIDPEFVNVRADFVRQLAQLEAPAADAAASAASKFALS